MSGFLTVVALAGFGVGLKVQDRLEPRAFDRAVLAFLLVLGVWLVVRAGRSWLGQCLTSRML